MLIARYENDKLVYDNHWVFSPNTSFGENGPSDQWLIDKGYYRVLDHIPHNPDTHKLMSVDPYFKDNAVYTVEVVEKTVEDLQKELDELAESIREKRNELLDKTDWRFRSDLTPSQEWIDYCEALRNVPQQEGFPVNIEWPIEPNKGS